MQRNTRSRPTDRPTDLPTDRSIVEERKDYRAKSDWPIFNGLINLAAISIWCIPNKVSKFSEAFATRLITISRKGTLRTRGKSNLTLERICMHSISGHIQSVSSRPLKRAKHPEYLHRRVLFFMPTQRCLYLTFMKSKNLGAASFCFCVLRVYINPS